MHPTYHPGTLQLAHPLQATGGCQPYLSRQRLVGDPTIFLQQAENFRIYSVHSLFHPIIPNSIRYTAIN